MSAVRRRGFLLDGALDCLEHVLSRLLGRVGIAHVEGVRVGDLSDLLCEVGVIDLA
jgi:hypothetical protein